MQSLNVPSLQSLLKSGDTPVYPYTKTFAQAKNEPFVALHTSGSTGLPKPVILNHGTMTHHDLFLKIPTMGGKRIGITQFRRMLFGLPMFHSARLCFMAYAIYSSTTIVIPSTSTLSTEAINHGHVYGRVDASFLSPNTIADLIRNPEYLENIKRLRYLTFGGAALPRDMGNKLKELTHLFVSFGATETGFMPLK